MALVASRRRWKRKFEKLKELYALFRVVPRSFDEAVEIWEDVEAFVFNNPELQPQIDAYLERRKHLFLEAES